MRVGDRRLYLCTPDRDDLPTFLTECVGGGVDLVQLREKRLEGAALAARAQLCREVCTDLGVPFIVNDLPQLAAEVGADGVHVGQDDLPAAEARRIVGEDLLVGLSTHRVEELGTALLEPVDYLSAGPVVPTPTKPGRPGTGLSYVTEAARRCAAAAVPMPLFVTGNANPETVGAIVAAGGRRVVAVRYLTESGDPREAARRLRAALDEALEAVGRG